MTDDEVQGLPVPPERPLPDGARARLRAEVLAGLDAADATAPSAWRWLAPAAVAAAVLVIVLGGALLLGRGAGEDGSAPPVAGGPSTATASPSVPGTTSPATRATTTAPATSAPAGGCDENGQRQYRAQLREVQAYRDLLAEHLDPSGEHLDAKASNVQSSGTACDPGALGTKVGWSADGQAGLGMVQVEVAASAPTQVQLGNEGWHPVPARGLGGVEKAEVAEYDGGVAVAVTRTDGLVVAIDADSLFGNNSTVGIGGFPFTTDDLLRTAADPSFTLPE